MEKTKCSIPMSAFISNVLLFPGGRGTVTQSTDRFTQLSDRRCVKSTAKLRKSRGSARLYAQLGGVGDDDGGKHQSEDKAPVTETSAAKNNWNERVELATPFGVAVRDLLSLPARVATVAEQCRTQEGIPQAQTRFEELRETIATGKMRNRLTAMQEAHFYPRALVVPVLLQVLSSAVVHARERQRLESTDAEVPVSSRPKNFSVPVLPDQVFDEMSRSQAAFSLAIMLGQTDMPSSDIVEEWRSVALDALIEVLEEDPDPAARAATAGALGHVGNRSSMHSAMLVRPLVDCFEKPGEDWIVRLSAAASLGLMRAREAMPLFIEELNKHDVKSDSGKSLLVQTVICALGDLANIPFSASEIDRELMQRAVRAIERYNESEDVLVRISVTESLGHWCQHSPRALAVVQSLMLDPNEHVAKTARFAIEVFEKQQQNVQSTGRSEDGHSD